MPTEEELRTAIEGLTPTGTLVHLAFRLDTIDEEQLRLQILRERRRIYEQTLTGLARQMGCDASVGRVPEGPLLSELNTLSAQEAESIVRTYNTDLARAIAQIYAETPTANRNTYARRLEAWDAARAEWKSAQIGMHIRGSATAQAQQAFLQNNGLYEPRARLLPPVGVCPVCQALIDMGLVDRATAEANPTPLHPNCPHVWVYEDLPKLGPGDCDLLWMGE